MTLLLQVPPPFVWLHSATGLGKVTRGKKNLTIEGFTACSGRILEAFVHQDGTQTTIHYVKSLYTLQSRTAGQRNYEPTHQKTTCQIWGFTWLGLGVSGSRMTRPSPPAPRQGERASWPHGRAQLESLETSWDALCPLHFGGLGMGLSMFYHDNSMIWHTDYMGMRWHKVEWG